MRLLYSKPKLNILLQGERIAFIRQFRKLTQDDVSDKLGITGECKRRTKTSICRNRIYRNNTNSWSSQKNKRNV